jgi:hypothetical protein
VNKKVKRSSIETTRLGILDGLNDLESNEFEPEETKSKYIKEYKSKSSLDKKSKRSFMLTEKQIEMVYLLKAKNPNKDLSTMVGEAIEKYFELNN